MQRQETCWPPTRILISCFAANDGGTIGAVMAVENAGQAGKTFVFGTDASEQIVLDLLKADNDILQAV